MTLRHRERLILTTSSSRIQVLSNQLALVAVSLHLNKGQVLISLVC